MREGLCLYTEYIESNKTIEICKRYKSPDIDDEEHDIVFVVNYCGTDFHVYETMLHAIGRICFGETHPMLFETGDEEALDTFLSGGPDA